MDLYRKKINIGNKVRRKLRDKYNETENNEKKERGDSYLKKMLEKKYVSQPKNDALNLSSENIKNVRSSLEDILSNENSKKKAIKYVIHIGKNKNIPTNNSISYDIEPHYDRTESPQFRGKGYNKGYYNSYKNSPARNINKPKLGKKYISINDYSNTDLNNPRRGHNDSLQKRMQNQDESQNEDISSFIEDERGRNPDPRVMNRINRVLQDRYENALRRPKEKRNRTIQAMPRLRKQFNTPVYTNYSVNYGNNKDLDNNDIDEIINAVDDLQRSNRNLQKDINNKDKEINSLKNQLDSLQKELDDKIIELNISNYCKIMIIILMILMN